ncbi:RINT-1 family protein [Hysterangium stoloniferum]|nr:RINT-1 family protein [Hysterangium stoloniferum]
MAATTIQRLLQPIDPSTSEDRTLALLNAQFPSLAEVEREGTLQTIAEDTRKKTEELRAELQQSQHSIHKLIRDTICTAHQHLSTARELSLTRHVLEDELVSLAGDLVSPLRSDLGQSPTLLEDLESLHRNLKELEGVKSYVVIVERMLRLSEAAVTQAQTTSLSSTASLSEYRRLQDFVSFVSSHFSAVENPSKAEAQEQTQSLNIVSFLYKVRDRTWSDIKGIFSAKLLESAEQMGWPQPIEYSSISALDRTNFETSFLDFVRLQDAGEEIHTSDSRWQPGGIYPIQSLTSPITLRFKFHFEGKRDTNRIDKPEWYFTHMANVAHTHRAFFTSIIQRLMSQTKHKNINAFREFILHLLSPITRKLRTSVPRILQHPSLLAHTVYQSLAFDASLREEGFSLEGTTAQKSNQPRGIDKKNDQWEGMSEEILGRKEWFEAWVEGERKFADDQYNGIISSSDAWKIADDADATDMTDLEVDFRPTNSARRVKALVEQITERYQPLPRFASRTRFLIAVQIPILESYHSRISSSLDAFETLSSSFVRAVPGALAGQVGHNTDSRSLTSGVEGVGRLVKAGVSAHYIAGAMDRWGEDMFFLELWSEINERAALRARAEIHPLLPDPLSKMATAQDVEVVSKGTIFQELVSQYQTLGRRAEDMIVRHVHTEVETASKAYFASQWDLSQNAPPNEKGLTIPTTLVVPISLLSSHLGFLARSLPNATSVTLYRRIASSLASVILQKRILQRPSGRLPLTEARQIAEESMLWVETCRMTMDRTVRRAEGPWSRLLDAMKILTVEADKFRSVVDLVFSTKSDDLEKLQYELGVTELGLSELISVVRLREDCWR